MRLNPTGTGKAGAMQGDLYAAAATAAVSASAATDCGTKQPTITLLNDIRCAFRLIRLLVVSIGTDFY